MKNYIFSLGLLLAFSLLMSNTSFGQNGNGNLNEQQLIGLATGAFQSSCSAPSSGAMIGTVSTTAICINGGFLSRVTFFPKLNCNQVDCDLVRVGPIGYVDFDCENNIIGVTCIN